MKPWLACCLLFSALAWAGEGEGWRSSPGEPGPRWEQQEEGRPRLSKEERRELRRQWLNSHQAGKDERSAGEERRRLTPEERQRLRRDVHEAGREFYRREEHRSPHEEGLPPGNRPSHPH